MHITAFWWLAAGMANLATAGTPEFKFCYEARSTLYAPPLVAEMHPSPGLETVISDAEARTLRCIDASGRQIWAYQGGWTRRLTSSAALSRTARSGRNTLIIGGSDGRLCCVDAETGKECWARAVGEVTWGGALWADLNNDGGDEVLVGTERAIVVLDANGKDLWSYKGRPGDPPLEIRCPIAAADIDGRGRPEIFAVDKRGPLCLDAQGSLRWWTLTGDDFTSAPLITDANHDGRPELYCSSSSEPAILAFDTRDGRLIWRFAMLSPTDVYPGSSFAAGDLDRDGFEEIAGGDASGHVYVLRHDGTLSWSFRTAKPAPAAVSMGDVDGDGDIEILAASGDHGLYCLDSRGGLKWRYSVDRRLVFPATIADVDNDGKTEILFCGSDRRVRCITLRGVYEPSLIPWPSRRFNAAQSGAAFPRKQSPAVASIGELRTLLPHGGFEKAKPAFGANDYPKSSGIREQRLSQPLGWNTDPPQSTGWTLDKTVFHGGASSVHVSKPLRLVSSPAVFDRTVRTVNASVYAKGHRAIGASLQWFGANGMLREDELGLQGEDNGWRLFAVRFITPPPGAQWLALVLSGEEAWWDDAEVVGALRVPPKVRALVNQVGYDLGMPKRFIVQSNFKADKATFVLVRQDGSEALSGTLKHVGRIRGHYGNDWGHEYWRGDFSDFNQPGRYRIKATLDQITDLSWPFEVGGNLIWNRTARPAYRFFYYQRCGFEVPGFHRACHLDDGITWQGRCYDLAGGWHDAGDYNKYQNAPYLHGLGRAYGIAKTAFDHQDEDGNGRSDFLDEILWGGDHVCRMIAPDGSAFGGITSGYGFWGPPDIETDNKPRTGDERPLDPPEAGVDPSLHHAAMAKIARYVTDKAPWVEAANRGLRWALDHKIRGLSQFTTAVDLYAATRDKKYADLARELFPKIGANEDVVDAVRSLDVLLGQDHSEEVRRVLVERAEGLLKLADNPFGVCTFGPADRPNFFGTPAEGDGWHVGTNSHLCQAATMAALAYRYAPDERYLVFIYDQLNWILGNNPFDVSQLEAVGSAFPPTYHNRIMFAGVSRGAVPGSLINGITFRAGGEDVPHLDMTGVDIPLFSSNECWLPHNTNYLNLLANLKACGGK